ncbi:hypothetical protein [Oscillibacter sp.]|uniref:hypothetical protein n=1 Tax=Oscillibacter sp. TaxID=1945593 RepID=UPI00216B9DE0|nr:hypothetical protein [Oscillibacter sp.]MCI9113019.1 hypothetical protein [Oscillibacter sp.]MCI9241449.1 hypothetical protein [Oscillibacter sp.]MCI9460450.1 hypothetical protein [Oscillibacter sp.]
MPELLGATNPVPGYDKTTVNRNITVSPDNTQIQNVPDPSKVVRADGRTEQQDSNLQGDGGIRYDSNFQTFLQRLRDTPSLADSLSRIFSGREGIVVSSGLSAGIAEEMGRLLEMLRMDESQLLDFLQGQFKTGTRFGGALFALLRSAYARAASEGVRTDILQFLKAYVDFDSTTHIEGNLLRDLQSMADAMPASWAEKLRDLTAQLQNGIAAGNRQGNLQLLQREIFPYMSSYVERTHDMGTPRALLTMLALNVARYENGSEEKLLEGFHQLSGYGTLKGQLGGIDDQSLLLLLKNRGGGDSKAVEFSNHLASAAARAFRGEGSAEVQQAFQNLIAAMLVNESVYMPINHYLLPLEWDGRMLFSELWVDPNAEDEQNRGGDGGARNTMRFLFKMDVQGLGLFDVILAAQGTDVDVQIACPDKAAPFSKQIGDAVSQILARNDLRPARVAVRRMDRPVTLTEVFPKIFEGKNSINVKI